MDILTIIKTINAVTQQADAVLDLIKDAKTVFSDAEAKQIEDALARLQAKNDALHERLTEKLRVAASKR